MNIVDAIIILFLLLGALLGFKKGFIKTMVSLIGIVVVIVASFYLKEPVANFMLKYFPFLNFSGIFKDLPVINILVYEAIAFLLIFILLSSILGIIINLSGIIEKLLNVTIILGFFSKILGAIAGLLETLAFIYIILFALAQFNLSSKFVLESKVGTAILERTPILSKVAAPTVASIEEIFNLQKTYKDGNKAQYNADALGILIKYNIITKEKAKELVESGKLHIPDLKIY